MKKNLLNLSTELPNRSETVVTVLSQRRPRVNSVTRPAYQAFIYNVSGAASKNQEVMRKARAFAKEHNLEWN